MGYHSMCMRHRARACEAVTYIATTNRCHAYLFLSDRLAGVEYALQNPDGAHHHTKHHHHTRCEDHTRHHTKTQRKGKKWVEYIPLLGGGPIKIEDNYQSPYSSYVV